MIKNLILLLSISILIISCAKNEPKSATLNTKKEDFALVIHGGAGTILKSDMTPAKDSAYRASLNEALTIGENVLKNGGKSIDAVEKVIEYLENNPLFNAGKGAVFTNEGKNELDASIMTGEDQKAGAIGGVTNVKNPIKLARAVMEQSEHVMLSGKGAEQFAKEKGLEIVDPSYFFTQMRWDGLQKIKKEELEKKTGFVDPMTVDKKFGTVGCVALDKSGNICAGTSTGGMTNKRWNRIGDAPIIGAGTYADNASCGVSATGHGEFFIRYTVARSISALVEYKNMSLQDAANEVVMKKLVEKGGEGGIVALDKMGNISMTFNSKGMYRGFLKSSGTRGVAIYKEDSSN
jgi:L-asparaginase / beta-aspartyl-peptidase